jgi:drug/metabolite transporter (DMT)-like permease
VALGTLGPMKVLERMSRPFLLLVAALLLAGVLLTAFNLLLLGWSVYALGHIGAIGAFLLVGLSYRSRMDAWAWAGLAVLIAGLVLALPQIASIWPEYSRTPTGRDMLLPGSQPPLGIVAQLVTSIGLAFYGLAARGARALPPGVGWAFVAAALIGLLADFGVISPLAWAPAMLLVALGLLAIGTGLTMPARAADSQPSAEPLT